MTAAGSHSHPLRLQLTRPALPLLATKLPKAGSKQVRERDDPKVPKRGMAEVGMPLCLDQGVVLVAPAQAVQVQHQQNGDQGTVNSLDECFASRTEVCVQFVSSLNL